MVSWLVNGLVPYRSLKPSSSRFSEWCFCQAWWKVNFNELIYIGKVAVFEGCKSCYVFFWGGGGSLLHMAWGGVCHLAVRWENCRRATLDICICIEVHFMHPCGMFVHAKCLFIQCVPPWLGFWKPICWTKTCWVPVKNSWVTRLHCWHSLKVATWMSRWVC